MLEDVHFLTICEVTIVCIEVDNWTFKINDKIKYWEKIKNYNTDTSKTDYIKIFLKECQPIWTVICLRSESEEELMFRERKSQHYKHPSNLVLNDPPVSLQINTWNNFSKEEEIHFVFWH